MRDGLKIIWDPEIDNGAWPGPLHHREAVAGETWLGPQGLLGRLETEVGLGGHYASPLERVADLAAKLANKTGWWRASYDVDALGTARRLLLDRDALVLWGWTGQKASERLSELWSSTENALPGLPDRLAAVRDALTRDRHDIAELVMHTPRAALPTLWTQTIDALATAGVRVHELPATPAAARGDLAAARTNQFTPTGDGSLLLLRAHGALAAADEVAAWLSSFEQLTGVVVIGADEVLDAALSRHGLPRGGAPTRPPASVHLLRLVVEAAFEPMDPRDLHALLTIDPSPIPRRVSSRLISALSELPGRRSQPWQAKLAEGLERCDESWRADAQARIQALLLPTAKRDAAISTAALSQRIAVLANWARARMKESPTLAVTVAMAEQMRVLLGSESHTLVALRRQLDELDGMHGPARLAEAGLHFVTTPGALLGPAKTIVWWNFNRESAPPPPRLRLSMHERAALQKLGVTPPDFAQTMQTRAVHWRRPLEMASDSLLMVCSKTSSAGDKNFPHPLWDELCSTMPRGANASVLTPTRLNGVRRTAVQARNLPIATTQVSVTQAVPLRERESPSSLERLLACSFSWAMNYHGHLRAGLSSGLGEPNPLLYGKVAHVLLAKVFEGGPLSADAAQARARQIIDTELDGFCESLALPLYQVRRSLVSQTVIRAAHAVGELLTTTRAQLGGIEMEVNGSLAGVPIGGRADFVLANPNIIVDFKWGSSTIESRLGSDTALQLALYAELLGAQHDVAYLALKKHVFYSHLGSKVPRARLLGRANVAQIVAATSATLANRRRELATGMLSAPSADGAKIKSALSGGQVTIEPPCQYCELGSLCGKEGAQ